MTKFIIIVVCWLNIVFVKASINICYDFPNNDKGQIEAKSKSNEDPIYIDSFKAHINHPAIVLDALLTNLTIWRQPESYTVLPSQQIINITYPNTTIVGNYNLTGNIGQLIDIFGKGDFWMHIYNLSVAVNILDLNLNGTAFCFRVSLDLGVQQIPLHFSGLMDDDELEELFNKLFNSLMPEMMVDVWEDLKQKNDQEIEDFINNLINGNIRLFSSLKKLTRKLDKERNIDYYDSLHENF